MRTRTLLQLRSMVRRRADVDYDTDRHTDAVLNDDLNQGIAELRGALTQDGATLYRAVTTATVSASDAVSGQPYATISFPADAERIESVDVRDDDVWSPLEHVDHRDRLGIASSTTSSCRPAAWSLFSFDSSTLAIYPRPDDTYTLAITYDVQHTDLSDDTDTLTVLPGFADWVTWYAAARIAERDGLDDLYQTASRGMAVAYQQARRSALSFAKTDRRRKPTRQRRGGLGLREVWDRL